MTGTPAFAADGYHLTGTSAAIDAGVDAGVTVDVDDDLRPFAARPDLGADEHLCRVRLNDSSTPYASVQAALDASAAPTDVVKVAGLCQRALPDGYGVAHITKTLTLRGGYSADFAIWDPQVYPTTLDALGRGPVVLMGEDISPTVETLRLTNGSTEGYGGGIWASRASPTVSGCLIYSNTAHDRGGGISLEHGSGARLLNNQIYSNTAANAGGIYLDRSTNATLIGNQVFGNLATPYSGYGGGLVLMSSPGALLMNNWIYRNTASKGVGGIWLNYITNTTLINTVIADNRAGTGGSGLYVEGSELRLLHTTIARNTGGDGSGIYITNDGPVSNVALTNTILAGHLVGITITQGNTATLNGVLWYSNTVNYSGAGVMVATNDIAGDPAFAADGYHLMADSKAINAGVDASVARDIDGQLRRAAPDLGADEFVSDCWVRLNDSLDDYTNVQAAIDASTRPTDVVKVAGYCAGVQARAGLTQTVYLSKTLVLRGGYTVTNWMMPDPIAHPTTLDAQGKGRVLYITGNVTPTIEGLHVTGGDAAGLGGVGGGMYVNQTQATLNHNQVYSNTAANGGGIYLQASAATLDGNVIVSNTAAGYGGGVYVNGGAPRLNRNTISHNESQTGGGVHLQTSGATLSGNTFSANLAQYGGGLFSYGSNARLVGNVLMENTATRQGGGLCMNFTWDTLTNTVVVDNQAFLNGSGLYLAQSAPRLLHTTIARNTGGEGSGVSIAHVGSIPSVVAMTNTILVSQAVGITVTASSTVTLNGVLWYSNTVNSTGAGVITVTNDMTGTPAFAADGYHLTVGSKAINAGVASGVATDIDSEPRLGLPDLGADEYVLQVFLPLVLRQ